MPAAAILNVVLLIILVLALGLSSTGLGLFAHNNGAPGKCFLKYSPSSNTSISGNRKFCNTSLAGYTIATLCIAGAIVIEFLKLQGMAVNTKWKTLQIVLLLISKAFLLISGVIVVHGWADTCKNLKDGGVTSCRINDQLAYINEEMIGSAVCALLGMILALIATLYYIVAVLKAIRTRNASTDLEEKAPITKYEINKHSYNHE